MSSHNVAANVQDLSGGPGSVGVYADAKGTPQLYSDHQIELLLFLSYDDRGNLFVDGSDSSGGFQFAELHRRSSTFTQIPLHVSIPDPTNVQWDGKYVAVGDAGSEGTSGGPVIYHVQVTHNRGKVVGVTSLTGTTGIFQFFIDGKTFIGPNLGNGNVEFWKYPAGGMPTKAVGGFNDPFGSAVSKGAK